MIPVTTFAGRKVAVLGLARSGLAAAQALIAGGAEVACWDDGESSRGRATAEGLPVVDLTTADWRAFAALVLAPGVPLTHPEPHWSVNAAHAAGIEVIGDTELFCRELARQSHRPKVVAITGTNGKSTTTALTTHLLRHAGFRTAMGGNIGEAVLGLAPFSETDIYVLELSSYQIDLMPTLAADAGVLLNLTPDHLDRHGTMAHYAEVKERLVARAGTAIIGIDDAYCRAIAERRMAAGGPAIAIHVTTDPTRSEDAVTAQDVRKFEASGKLVQTGDHGVAGLPVGSLSLAHAPTLRGPHNAQNAAAACCAALAVVADKTRVARDILQAGLNSYPGLAHRMELVGTLHKSPFVNDSKATNADSTAKALTSWGNGLHWIVGGLSKEGGIDSLAPFFQRVRRAYLIGAASHAFAATLARHGVDYVRCVTLERAVAEAAAYVRANPQEAGSVVFSPACASFDQFKDFEDRGNQFRTLVRALPAFVPHGQGGMA